ncbi:MAG: SapC family protein, partial [Comamonas sp.]
MENNVHLIQKDIDGQKGWKPHNNYQFVANKQFLPVGLTELSALLPIYPLGILRVATGAAKLVAIVGREAERNLFVAPDGRWTAP